jgi:hypothetical protein
MKRNHIQFGVGFFLNQVIFQTPSLCPCVKAEEEPELECTNFEEPQPEP